MKLEFEDTEIQEAYANLESLAAMQDRVNGDQDEWQYFETKRKKLLASLYALRHNEGTKYDLLDLRGYLESEVEQKLIEILFSVISALDSSHIKPN